MQDEQFDYIDEGWAAMKQVLDQEMPVKKRRAVFWWWLLLAGTTLMLAILAITYDGSEDVKDIPSGHQTPSNVIASSKLSESANNQSGHTGDNIPERSEGKASVKETASTVTPVPYLVLDREKKLDASVPVPVLVPEARDLPFGYAQDPLFIALTPLRSIPDYVRILPRKGSVVRVTTKDKSPDMELSCASKPAAQLWVAGTFHSGADRWASGTSVAVFLRKPIKKWSFDGGLGFGRRNLRFDGQGNQDLDSRIDGIPIVTNGAEMDESTNNILPTTFSLKSDQFMAHVHANRKLGSRWSLGAGVQVNYWSRAVQDWSYNPTSDPNVEVSFSEFQLAVSGRKGQQFSPDYYNAFGVGLRMNVNYQWHPRWQVGLGVHYGLSDHSQLRNYQLYDHYGQLTARYRIH